MNNLEFIVSYIKDADLGYTFDNVFHIGGFPITSKLALSFLIHYIASLIWGDDDELSKLALQTRNSKAIEWYKLDELVCPNPFKENEP